MAGAGIGLLLGPASTDAVNRAIDASYGEVTGITQTVRNYGSSLGIAVLGTLLTMTFAPPDQLVHGRRCPASAAPSAAHRRPAVAPARRARHAPPGFARRSRRRGHDFAIATLAVLIGMASRWGSASWPRSATRAAPPPAKPDAPPAARERLRRRPSSEFGTHPAPGPVPLAARR